MSCLTLTVGLPRSGKSSWAREQKTPIVNPDSIRLALHGKAFIKEREDEVWAIAYLMTRALLLAGHMEIIIDATSVTQRSRDAWAKEFPECIIKLMWFDTSKEECIKRARGGKRAYLIPVIERMASQWEDPRKEK